MLAAHDSAPRVYGDLQLSYNDPTKLICANRYAAGHWLSGNTGLWLEHVIKAGPFPERPTHYPELNNIQRLFQYGISIWPLEHVEVLHHAHNTGGIVQRVAYMRDPHSGGLTYRPVKSCAIADLAIDQEPCVNRDIALERKRLGRWLP